MKLVDSSSWTPAIVSADLSRRQHQCMTLVAAGHTSKEIARELGISPSTVDNHIHAVVERLGAINRVEAARMIFEPTPHEFPQDFWKQLHSAPMFDPIAPERLANENGHFQADRVREYSVGRGLFIRFAKLAGTLLIGVIMIVYLFTSVVNLVKLL